MPMMQILKQDKKRMAQQPREQSRALRSFLHRLDVWPDGGQGSILLFFIGKLLEEGVEGEARSEMVHARKDELRKRLDDLLPFAQGAFGEHLRQNSELAGEVGEEVEQAVEGGAI